MPAGTPSGPVEEIQARQATVEQLGRCDAAEVELEAELRADDGFHLVG